MPPQPLAPGAGASRPPIARIAIVMLTYDAPPGVLEAAIAAVLADAADRAGPSLAGGPPEVDVVVVDNGGDARARLAGAGHDVTVVEPGGNGGYGAGMNVGIERALAAGADAVALLNDDVVVTPGWLTPLVAELDAASDVGAVQPTLLAGRPGADGPPTVNGAGVVIDPAGAGSDRLRGEPADAVQAGPVDVIACTGGAMVVHRAFLDDVGGFDERFFLYYEDVELARRGTRRGWRYRHVPASQVWHLGSATVERLGDDVIRLRERNRLWSSALHGPIAELGRGLWLSVRRLRHEPRAAHRRALVGALPGIAVRLVERLMRHRRAPHPHAGGRR